jgi:hypothetical protein
MEPYKTFDIAFGRGHLAVGLPEEAEMTMIRKATLPKLADHTGAIPAACLLPQTSSRNGAVCHPKS